MFGRSWVSQKSTWGLSQYRRHIFSQTSLSCGRQTVTSQWDESAQMVSEKVKVIIIAHIHKCSLHPEWHCGKSSSSNQGTAPPRFLPTTEEVRHTLTMCDNYIICRKSIFLIMTLDSIPCTGSVIWATVLQHRGAISSTTVPRRVVGVREHPLPRSQCRAEPGFRS